MLIRLFRTLFFVLAAALATGCASTATERSTGEYTDDTAIATKARLALIEAKDVKFTEIKVDVYRGVVQLSGFAESSEMAQRAVAIVRDIKGVKSVKNDVQVRK
jgi:hyperosmotically inducible periplasmic protein